MYKKKREPHHQVHGAETPYWKRAHRDWRVILAIVLMLAAMAIYILTLDESTSPSGKKEILAPALGGS